MPWLFESKPKKMFEIFTLEVHGLKPPERHPKMKRMKTRFLLTVN